MALSESVNKTKCQIESLGFSSTEFQSLDVQKDELEAEIPELSDRVENLTAQLQSRLSFRYSDPVRGFDRSKVKGVVAKLIEVKDSQHATALEVVAGGKLFQVVVDEVITGKALLDRGKLERRVTIIPLDKIQPRQLTESTCERASQIATSLQANANPAIELVGFDEEVRSAIEYVFSSTIIVDSVKAANLICDTTKTRTVTLDGDVYDPSGTISGGSKNQLGTTLANLCELTELSTTLETKRSELTSVRNKHSALKKALISYDKLNANLGLAETELSTILKQLSQTKFGMLLERRDLMENELKCAEDDCELMTKEKDEKWKLFLNLQEKEAELTKQREDLLASIDKEVESAKLTVAKHSKLFREVSKVSDSFCVLKHQKSKPSFLRRSNPNLRKLSWKFQILAKRSLLQKKPFVLQNRQ